MQTAADRVDAGRPAGARRLPTAAVPCVAGAAPDSRCARVAINTRGPDPPRRGAARPARTAAGSPRSRRRSHRAGSSPLRCGVTVMPGSVQKGWSPGSGSTAKTSSTARMRPLRTARRRAPSSSVAPRPTLISSAPSFIASGSIEPAGLGRVRQGADQEVDSGGELPASIRGEDPVDMRPRPRRACQAPDLHPEGLAPGRDFQADGPDAGNPQPLARQRLRPERIPAALRLRRADPAQLLGVGQHVGEGVLAHGRAEQPLHAGDQHPRRHRRRDQVLHPGAHLPGSSAGGGPRAAGPGEPPAEEDVGLPDGAGGLFPAGARNQPVIGRIGYQTLQQVRIRIGPLCLVDSESPWRYRSLLFTARRGRASEPRAAHPVARRRRWPCPGPARRPP